MYAIVDRVVDAYPPASAAIAQDIAEVEAEVFSAARRNPVQRIYKLRQEVVEFDGATAPLLPARAAHLGRPAACPTKIREYYRDVADHLVRVTEQLETFRELLSSILQANLTQVSVRQNEDMRRISAWVAIIAVPTAIAGIYGMNFDHMPELDLALRLSHGPPGDRGRVQLPLLALPPFGLALGNKPARRPSKGQMIRTGLALCAAIGALTAAGCGGNEPSAWQRLPDSPLSPRES